MDKSKINDSSKPPVDEHNNDFSKFGDLLILYGSQTGTSEDVAERIARDALRYDLTPYVSSMDGVSFDALCQYVKQKNKWVIFLASTTGQGHTPDNMTKFWKALCRSSLSEGTFNEMKYGVIAFGDSSYEKFNFVGKKLFRRLKQLGAKEVLDICLADDQHDLGYHATVNPWINSWWQLVTGCREKSGTVELIPRFIVSEHADVANTYDKLIPQPNTMEFREMIGNDRQSAESHWQDTRLITFDLSASSLLYNPGDVLCVQPANLPTMIKKFFEIFPELQTAPPVYVVQNPDVPWARISSEVLRCMGPLPWSWTNIVTHLMDIQSVPKNYFFEVLHFYATNELEKEKLQEYCSPEGQEELYDYCHRQKRNILEVFEDFPCTTRNIPPNILFDIIPPIKPRSFSIASSTRFSGSKVQILVAVVKYATRIKTPRFGLCSNFLANYCFPGTLVPIWVQRGSFTFPSPEDNSVVIMIGPGTGVAPFRSVILEHADNWDEKWLFFGCRNEKLDYYFKEEWEELVSKNKLKFACAFSRDSAGNFREYVQDQILAHKTELGKIFTTKKFAIYIAGNSKGMPKDVQSAIENVMKVAGLDNAINLLNKCIREGRYQTETWS